MLVRRHYHVHLPGLAFSGVAVLLALGAFSVGNNLLLWGFGLALGLLLVSGVISGAMLMRLEVSRLPVERASAGGPLPVRYAVRNRSRWMPGFALTIEEVSWDARRRLSLRRAAEPGEDGPPGSPPRAGVVFGPAFVAHVAPGSVCEAASASAASARGELLLSHFAVTSTFPFGVFKKSVVFEQRQTVLVHPKIGEVPAPPPGSAVQVDAPQSGSPGRPAAADEFFSLREYVPGDSPRLIAWKASARTGSIRVRQTSSPPAPRSLVVLSIPEGLERDRRERTIEAAAGLAARVLRRGEEVALLAPGARGRPRFGRGAAQLTRVLDQLALVAPGPTPAVAQGDARYRGVRLLPVRPDSVAAGPSPPAPARAAPGKSANSADRPWGRTPHRARASS